MFSHLFKYSLYVVSFNRILSRNIQHSHTYIYIVGIFHCRVYKFVEMATMAVPKFMCSPGSPVLPKMVFSKGQKLWVKSRFKFVWQPKNKFSPNFNSFLKPPKPRRLSVSSLWMFHPPSSVLRSRGSTWRSKLRPLGRKGSEACHQANIMVARVMVLVLLASAKGCWWLLEQPGSSLMEYHPTFQKTLGLLGSVRRLSLNLGDFGHQSRKATLLYSRNSGVCIWSMFCFH